MRNVEDHVVGLRILTLLAIDGATQMQVVAIGVVGHVGDPRPNRRKTASAFAHVELRRATHVLQPPVGNVLAYTETSDVLPCVCLDNVAAALANNDHQFRLVVHRFANHCHIACGRIQRALKLAEHQRQGRQRASHFGGMLFVVQANGKHLSRARNRAIQFFECYGNSA